MSKSNKSAAKALLAGAAGGLLGTLALDLFQKFALESTRKAENGPQTYTHQQQDQIQNYEQAHTATAESLAQAAGASLSPKQRKAAAPATHYLFGTVCGAAYGLLAEYWPPATLGFGTAFGISLQIGATESILPALGLMPSPLDTPPPLHLGGIAVHSVYGAATEATRRLLRS